jgi:UDP:flavonoid glycosyltransferase YjiC (YdhE family)
MKILFASQAIDGHFNPMTGFAVRLRDLGHEVAWYTGPVFTEKLRLLGIPLMPFRRAIEHRADNLNELYPERAKLKGPRAMGFDAEKIFASNTANFFEDMREFRRDFPFDAAVVDNTMLVQRLLSRVMQVPVVSFVPVPNMESDPLVPPLFFGFRPARNLRERALHRMAGLVSEKVILKSARRSYVRQHAVYGQPVPRSGPLTDETYLCSDAVIQTGWESLDFPRGTINPKVHYVGALLPYRPSQPSEEAVDELSRLALTFAATLLITQGTVDNLDHNKLIIPALDAVKDMDALVVVATGGRGTQELRARYPQPNIVIRDFVDFATVLEFTDVFISNGGFGGVQLSLSKGVPLVVSGINEGKSDVNARVEHAGVGISLRTEAPKSADIADAVSEVLTDPRWKARAQAMREQFDSQEPVAAAAAVVESVGPATK